MPTPAMAMPYISANLKAISIAATMIIMGGRVLIRPLAKPLVNSVPGPVWADSAMPSVGL